MAVTTGDLRPSSGLGTWRTPLVIIICGCAIALLSFGPRSSLGFFVQPMSREFAWGRDVFGLALALQNLLWGLGQPIAGAIADRFGIMRVMIVGALLYAGGLLLMRYADDAAVARSRRRRPDRLRAFRLFVQPRAVGVQQAAAAGEARPCARRRHRGRLVRAIPVRAVRRGDDRQFRLAGGADGVRVADAADRAAVARDRDAAGDVVECLRAADQQSFKTALAEAFGHRSYVLLVLGFFTCGFQLAFITVHLPAYLVDRGVSAQTGGWVVAAIGLFNIIGSLSVGWLQNKYPKRYILSVIYFARALSIVAFISFPITTFSAIVFGAVTGLTWLSTVPPTSALVALMFGTRWFATLYGFAFVSHQVGGFLGVWLGGIVFEQFGSYTPIWWLSVLFGVLSALINLPIVETAGRAPGCATRLMR